MIKDDRGGPMTGRDWFDVIMFAELYVCGYLEGARDERKHNPRQSTRPPD